MIALRARLEDLDGMPVININDVPLQGFNSSSSARSTSRISGAALVVLGAAARRSSRCSSSSRSRGPVFYRQERMGLDGKPFSIVKFRSMYDDAERDTGPVWTSRTIRA